MGRLWALFFAVGLLVSLLSVTAVRASAWEWLTDLHGGIGSGGLGETVQSDDEIKIFYDVHTSKNYYEYRNVYYYVTTTGWWSWTPPADWAYFTEYATTTPSCRKQGYVNGTINDELCETHAPIVATTSTLWTRATVNYEGCGTWTPTPDVVNCGHYLQTTSTLTP